MSEGWSHNRGMSITEVEEDWMRKHGGGKKGGDVVIKFDIVMCGVEAVRAVSLLVAIRRLARPFGLDTQDLQDMEREFRVAAAELQRVEGLLSAGPCEVKNKG